MRRQRDLFVALIHVAGGSIFALVIALSDFQPLSYFVGSGLPFVFVAAFLEAVYLVGLYFPGSAIMVAALLAPQGFLEAVPVVVVIWGGTLAGLACDVLLARFLPSWMRQPLELPGRRHGRWQPVMWAVHPNLSATFIFDRSARGLLKLEDALGVAIGSLAFLIVYSALLQVVGLVARSEQRTLSLMWAVFVIAIGLYGVAQAVRSRSH